MTSVTLIVALVASAGCVGCAGDDGDDGDDGPTFPLTVTVHDDAGRPRAGARIVFASPDGASTEALTDGAGQATATIAFGGSAWLFEQIFSDVHLTAFTGLVDGDAPLFGRADAPVARAPVATVTVAGTPPASAEAFQLVAGSRCAVGTADGTLTSRLTVDARCAPTTDVLAVAYDRGPSGAWQHVVAWALLPAQPIVDGATITVPAAAWRAPTLVELRLRGAPDGVYADYQTSLTDDFGTLVRPADGTTGTVRAFLPLAGDHLAIRTTFHRDQLQQQVVAAIPTTAPYQLDTTRVLAPWVTQYGRGPVRWAGNDDGGSLASHATVLTQRWPVTDAIGQPLTVTLRTIARELPPPAIPLPVVPAALAAFAPPYVEQTRLQLVRFGDLAPADRDRYRDDVARAATAAELLEPQVVPAAVSQTVGVVVEP